MKYLASFVALAAALSVPAQAQVAEWGQCGGIGYTGSTVCASGFTCTEINAVRQVLSYGRVTITQG